MRTITFVFALASALLAYAPKADARPAEKRGTIEVTGRAVRAVTTGPVLLHGYSGFSGGAIFVAPVGAGADADCTAALANNRSARSIPLVADRVAYVPVAAGQVACLVTDTRRPSSCSGTPSQPGVRKPTWPAPRPADEPAHDI